MSHVNFNHVILIRNAHYSNRSIQNFSIRIGCIACLLIIWNLSYAQTGLITKNNYTGNWESPSSWIPYWPEPQKESSISNVTINGYISCNGSLNYGSTEDTLFVNDTLIIYGDLTIGNKNYLMVNDNGILIVHGNLITSNKTNIKSDACIVITGDYVKLGNDGNGSFISNETPSNVYIGGTVPEGLDETLYPVLNCPGDFPYVNSACSYGNMIDFEENPVYDFFSKTCYTTAPIITASGPLTFCDQDSVVLSSGNGISYLWSTGESSPSIIVYEPGNYTVRTTSAFGCPDSISASVAITVNALPEATITLNENSGIAINDGLICRGFSGSLTASGGTSYLWSNGATSQTIQVVNSGTYTVTVTDNNGCTGEASGPFDIRIQELPDVSVLITENSGMYSNDGIICNGTSALLSTSGGEHYQWSTGQTTHNIEVSTQGYYIVSVTDSNACVGSDSVFVKITPEIIIDIETESNVCGLESAINAHSVAGTGEWNIVSGPGDILFNSAKENPFARIIASAYGTYQMIWSESNENCLTSSQATVTFHAVPSANAGSDQHLENTDATLLDAALESLQTGEWTVFEGSAIFQDIQAPASEVTDLSPGKNVLVWKVSSDYCSSTDTVVIDSYNLFLPQIITPNGDTKNDFFIIDYIEENAPAELVVFSRWGYEVYNNANYQNDWDGRHNNGELLSNDTYFYVLKFANGKSFKGFIVIEK